jgi:selenocysteine lyase/cysteine desulfurase
LKTTHVERSPQLTRRESLLALGGTAVGLGLLSNSGQAIAAAADGPADWDQVAKHFLLDRELAYLNTGSLGASPQASLDAVRTAAQRIEANPVAQGFGAVLTEAEQTRQQFADLLGCKLDEVLLTGNTTDGMNLVAEGLNLQPGTTC